VAARPPRDPPFSIRESDRCLETHGRPSSQGQRGPPFSIRESDRCLETLRRQIAPRRAPTFSIRESDRCLETCCPAPQIAPAPDFQYPRVGSLPRNSFQVRRLHRGRSTFSIRESDRCLETMAFIYTWTVLGFAFSIRESDRCLETLTADKPLRIWLELSVSASRIVASKPSAIRLSRSGPVCFQYPRVGSLPRNSWST